MRSRFKYRNFSLSFFILSIKESSTIYKENIKDKMYHVDYVIEELNNLYLYMYIFENSFNHLLSKFQGESADNIIF